MLTSCVGGIWAIAFYLQQRHAENARFIKELMTDFNARYDRMNGELQTSLWTSAEFRNEQKLMFIDYFNLCAEEWLFWQKGYVDKFVWNAWRNGMHQYAKDPRVKKLWMEELATNSYYGFELPE